MRGLAWAGLAAAFIAFPAALEAQACIGVPMGPRAFSLAGDVGFLDGAKSYGGLATVRVGQNISLQGRLDYVKADDAPPDVDDSTTLYGGQLAYVAAETEQLSVCPLVGARYFKEEEEGFGEVSALQIPIGVGIGLMIPSEQLNFSVFATPQLLYTRARAEVLGLETEEDSTDFGAEIGGRARIGAFFFGASVIVTSVEGSDAEMHVGAGIVIGG